MVGSMYGIASMVRCWSDYRVTLVLSTVWLGIGRKTTCLHLPVMTELLECRAVVIWTHRLANRKLVGGNQSNLVCLGFSISSLLGAVPL